MAVNLGGDNIALGGEAVNLDVCTLVAWVSELTRSASPAAHGNPFLQQQARQEEAEPLWPTLQALTRGKQLVVCETALQRFKEIASNSGGPTEQERAKNLIAELTVVPDLPSERVSALRLTAAVNTMAKTIFGTGDSLKAVTLTSNRRFLQAASQQGVCVAATVHSPRSLAERSRLVGEQRGTD